ncbi:Permease of the drug/metabolite transporter (DMT) superfamily [Marininema mesophilum]|uniref:Permease of the drug/metabolite transporter (DMT) superfamily n=1 Tax=Marininema mesophilum TaxID=1048340 RepID=A0A1H2T4P2_9BACL|nr:DMT family transporter [Marininema mesophilum]SDW38851.1 Permease of the drug/metabolite transporter (DMT) superfamily [Marininema mesophilum]
MTRFIAIIAAIFVTFLWSASYILNKLAFGEGIDPYMLAGLRYTIAASTLLMLFMFIKKHSTPISIRSRMRFKHYLLLGIAGYLMAQGLQYAGQFFISPTQTSMLLSVGNNLFVILVDLLWLREVKNRGVLLGVFGILLYYYPWQFQAGNLIGIGLVILSSIGYTINLTATRHFITNKTVKAENLVIGPMFIGAIFMIVVGFFRGGVPHISLMLIWILIWLGIVSGALAFYLWTLTQKTLKAYESSVLNNLVLIQVATMDVFILSQELTVLQISALIIILAAIIYVQFHPYFYIKKKKYN